MSNRNQSNLIDQSSVFDDECWSCNPRAVAALVRDCEEAEAIDRQLSDLSTTTDLAVLVDAAQNTKNHKWIMAIVNNPAVTPAILDICVGNAQTYTLGDIAAIHPQYLSMLDQRIAANIEASFWI
jgi:hypothetical protein